MNYIKKKSTGMLIKVGLIFFILISSCDKGFEEMNKNPNAYTKPVIGSLFADAVIKHASANGQISDPDLMEAGAWVQYLASLSLAEFYGDKYLWLQGNYERFWIQAYSSELKGVVDIITRTNEDPEMVNANSIARIWRVEILHRVTDMYGDVPYFEAGEGFINGIYKPKYDKQADIYADMLKELEESAQALTASKPSLGSADFLYGGNVDQWKRFSYSMMLRLGMRLTKVDPVMAETWVKKAIAGGVMQSNEDIARLAHTSATSTNWNVNTQYLQQKFIPLSAKGITAVKINKTFVDHLKATNDPRLSFYATLWQGNADLSQIPEYSAIDRQKGLPGGQDHTSIKSVVSNWTDASLAEFSEWNIHTVGHLDAPTIFQNYSEVEYLLAEAALRGWHSGSAKEHYDKGVLASMEIQSYYPNGMNSAEAIAAANAYLAANPYVVGSFPEQMKQIHTQFWVSQFMSSNVEAYSNWRRTGYPELVPYNYPGNATGGTIPRRVRYSTTDASINEENYEAAVSTQGPDLFTTRIWWDKDN